MTDTDVQAKPRESVVGNSTAGGNALVVWILAGVIVLSFAFGAFMYSSPEQRAQKLQEIKQKYEAKRHDHHNLKGSSSGGAQR